MRKMIQPSLKIRKFFSCQRTYNNRCLTQESMEKNLTFPKLQTENELQWNLLLFSTTLRIRHRPLPFLTLDLALPSFHRNSKLPSPPSWLLHRILEDAAVSAGAAGADATAAAVGAGNAAVGANDGRAPATVVDERSCRSD
jgi:hypothetical protein